jgi:hypothetical protein
MLEKQNFFKKKSFPHVENFTVRIRLNNSIFAQLTFSSKHAAHIYLHIEL